MKSFKNLKEIKNRDEYIKICETNYANTFFNVIGEDEEVERILPTEIINMNLENKFIDIRVLTKSGKIIILEGHKGALKRHHLERYYGYHKDTFCDFSKDVKTIIGCLSDETILKKVMVEENVCFKPRIIEFKKIDGDKILNKLRKKFKNQVELDHHDCGLLVHLPLFRLSISEKEYIHEICDYIKKYDCIPEDEKNTIIPAMYLNIEEYIDDEYEQEKLLEAINMLKYCENALDKKIRLAREDEAEKVTEDVKENLARKLLKSGQDENYVCEMTELDFETVRNIKLSL